MKKTLTAITISTLLTSMTAYAHDRLPTISPNQYTQEQKNAAAEFEATRKVVVFGPFEPLMHSPQFMNLASNMGNYLRYNSAIGTTLSELAILVVAREWSQDLEWHIHKPIALKAGLRPELVDAIADGRRPTGMSDDESMIYDFLIELNHTKRVSDVTYARVEKRFGNKGVVDLSGINGYYTLLAMLMNVGQYKIPDGGKKMVRFPE